MKKYTKKLNYTYTLGVYPTLELINKKPGEIIKVVLNPKSDANKGVQEIKKLCTEKNIEFEYSLKNLKKVSVKENTYAAGFFKKYDSNVKNGENHLVLVNPTDPGNLGTIIRTMSGFGVYNLIVIRPGVDVFDPKTIRASMGSLFDINFEYFDSFKSYQQKFPQNSIYTFMLNGNKKLKNTTFAKPFSLVFGPESSGLDDSFLNIGESVHIEHENSIDSLNLSMAVGVVLYKSYINK